MIKKQNTFYEDPSGPATVLHPEYFCLQADWEQWRSIYEGGREFVRCYLKKFSNRESDPDFEARKCVTPSSAFAKAAINEIKNSIFQRLVDIKRAGGSDSYINACKGENGGVDGSGASMSWFIGEKILPELLTMKKVGLYIDNGEVGKTLADQSPKPYIYIYKAEDIRSWAYVDPKKKEEFSRVLLREHDYDLDPETQLPIGCTDRFRMMWINDLGTVSVQYYDSYGKATGQEIVLGIKKIPFVVFEISDSLLKDVAGHQVALLNLDSSDIGYLLKSNFPFYTEQRDSRASAITKAAQGAYLQGLNGTDDPDPLKNPDLLVEQVDVGTGHGRHYDKGTERPGFIAPPTEPIKASMEKQKDLKQDIRTLVHLSLSNLQPKMASAESKQLDMSGLESGLSYIGIELEHGENLIATFWGLYEGSKAKSAKITYPEKWSLKTELDKREEVKQLRDIRESVPSSTFKKNINIQIADKLLGGRVSENELEIIKSEINNSKIQTSDPDSIIAQFEAGLIPGDQAVIALGYPTQFYDNAKADFAERLARIKDAQTSAARGVDAPPQTGVNDKKGKPTRGNAQ